jgi:hypothetical protein
MLSFRQNRGYALLTEGRFMKCMPGTACCVLLMVSVASAPAQGAGTPSVASLPPVVVKTVPASGDKKVNPGLREIRVTFSKDMKTKKMWSFVQESPDTFPQTTGEPHYLKDRRTVVLPVSLKPGKVYVLWINKGKFNAFRDTANHPAVPYLLVFETRK